MAPCGRYALSLERKETTERRGQRKERLAAFRALLQRTPEVTVDAPWRRVQSILDSHEAFRAIEKIDRLAVFEEHVRELEQSDDQARHAAKEAKRRRERKQRDAFRARLLAMHRDGVLGPRARWRVVVEGLVGTSEYKGAIEQSGSTPAELFEDVLEQINDEYAAHRKAVKPVLAAANYEVGEACTLAEL